MKGVQDSLMSPLFPYTAKRGPFQLQQRSRPIVRPFSKPQRVLSSICMFRVALTS